MKIAIVGAGISGLTAAHLLHRRHEIAVFEANAYAGGHTNTIRVDTEYETHHVDTGFIVFNDRNYPNFERLLDQIGVPAQPSDMSFAVSDERGDFEYASTSANGLFANRAHLAKPWFHRMLADVIRFQRAGRELLATYGGGGSQTAAGGAGRLAAAGGPAQPGVTHRLAATGDSGTSPAANGPSLGHWVEELRFSRPFIDRLIVPQA